MSAPVIIDFPSITGETLDDLDAIINARLSGEDDLHFTARITRLQITTWLNAFRDLENGRLNHNCSDVIRKLESQERRAKLSMESYSELLSEALHGR